MNGTILVVDNVTKRFGGLTANANISFSMNKGEIIGLIGRTAPVNPRCLTASLASTTQTAERSPSRARISPARIRNPSAGWGSAAPSRSSGSSRYERSGKYHDRAFLRNPGRKEAEAKAKEVAEIFGFMEKLSLKAVSLTISEQKRLEVARVFATGPEIMLLDEMMAGLNIQEVRETVELILR